MGTKALRAWRFFSTLSHKMLSLLKRGDHERGAGLNDGETARGGARGERHRQVVGAEEEVAQVATC